MMQIAKHTAVVAVIALGVSIDFSACLVNVRNFSLAGVKFHAPWGPSLISAGNYRSASCGLVPDISTSCGANGTSPSFFSLLQPA